MQIQDLTLKLAEHSQSGYTFHCQEIAGDVPVLQVIVDGFEELPIFVSATETQILCISYLWSEKEVKQESRADMLESMLEVNIPMPLSSFSKISDQYVIFGALSINSSLDDIVYELTTLSENAVEVIVAFEDYLV